ncbi:MAG: helix-turn-helix domain-containing protein [Rhodoplanes sp.]
MAEIPVVGRVLIWAREYRGLSLEDTAERLGMSAAYLEAIEADAAKPSLTKFEKMAAVYKLPLSTLFRRIPPSAFLGRITVALFLKSAARKFWRSASPAGRANRT